MLFLSGLLESRVEGKRQIDNQSLLEEWQKKLIFKNSGELHQEWTEVGVRAMDVRLPHIKHS